MTRPNEETIKKLNDEYPKDARVELIKMNDSQAPTIGTKGTVMAVDDLGSILVKWDSGSRLSVLYGVDVCRRIK